MVGIGIIGTGKQGADHARRIASLGDKARLVTVHDYDRGLAQQVADNCGAAVATNDQALIDDPEVDAIIVASSTETHVEFVLACIAAGKPVLTEKPLGITVPSCELVLDAEMAAGRRYTTVGFMRRFDPEYRRLKATIEGHPGDGDVGIKGKLYGEVHGLPAGTLLDDDGQSVEPLPSDFGWLVGGQIGVLAHKLD